MRNKFEFYYYYRFLLVLIQYNSKIDRISLLLIIDFKKNKLPVGPPDQFKVASSQVERELISVGFTIEKTDRETLDYQYIILATKPGATDK